MGRSFSICFFSISTPFSISFSLYSSCTSFPSPNIQLATSTSGTVHDGISFTTSSAGMDSSIVDAEDEAIARSKMPTQNWMSALRNAV